MIYKTFIFHLRRYIFFNLCIVLFVAGSASYKNAYASGGNYNVIIICLDTLRADHLGCYGYLRDTSRNIDKLARRGILFEWAFAQSNFTLASHASLFTSRYVRSHKADRIERNLSENEVTLAEVLRDNGYKTAAFIYNAVLFSPRYGLNQGFETYSFGEEDDKRISFVKTLPAALEWIGGHKDDKFFVFLHANDIHQPYHSCFENFFDSGYKGRLDNENFAWGTTFARNNPSRTPREIKHIIAHYDGGIKYADTFIGKLTRQLDDWGLSDKTIIILLSDHGEILAERGKGSRFCHGFSLYDEEVHVPLILIHPGIKRKGIRIHKQVQLIDVMPTILDFLGIERRDIKMEGRSLIDVISGIENNDFNKYVYAECISGESDKNGIINRQVMVRSSSRKIISSVWDIKEEMRKSFPITIRLWNEAIISLPQDTVEEFKLYDLKKDKGEKVNIMGKGRNQAERELLNKIIAMF